MDVSGIKYGKEANRLASPRKEEGRGKKEEGRMSIIAV
jgi:hypothetical protein